MTFPCNDYIPSLTDNFLADERTKFLQDKQVFKQLEQTVKRLEMSREENKLCQKICDEHEDKR